MSNSIYDLLAQPPVFTRPRFFVTHSIEFKVNGIPKKWKLEKTGYIADHFIQRFSYLPKELRTKRKYTYFDDGGQQFVIDYATDEEQKIFNQKTGLDRKWLGEGNHFGEPKE